MLKRLFPCRGAFQGRRLPGFSGSAFGLITKCTITSIEKPVADLEARIIELKKLAKTGEAIDVGEEISRLRSARRKRARRLQGADSMAEGAVARHPDRPHCLDYVRRLLTEFTPLAGDRTFGEDARHRRGFRPFPRRVDRGDRPGEGDDTRAG